VTPSLVGAETLGSSGGYTPPEDLQVSAPTEMWKKIWTGECIKTPTGAELSSELLRF
jgi:hypothetical protein